MLAVNDLLIRMIERIAFSIDHTLEARKLLPAIIDAKENRTIFCQLPRQCGKTIALLQLMVTHKAVLIVRDTIQKDRLIHKSADRFRTFTMAEFEDPEFDDRIRGIEVEIIMFDDFENLSKARHRYAENRRIMFVMFGSC